MKEGSVTQHGKSFGAPYVGVRQQEIGDGMAWLQRMAEGLVVSGEDGRLGNLSTPMSVRKLQRALHVKAKAEPGYRFYALYDKLYRPDVLTHAYRRCCANKGAPGVDGQSFDDIERYGQERWLGELAQLLKEQTYRPDAIKRVNIPKPDGKVRPLGLSTLRDRVCMMAAVLVLESIFEADLPQEQYGYRPKRSAHDALSAVKVGMNSGYPEVVDADLSAYFDTIPHRELMVCVARRVVDRRMLSLVHTWLRCPVEESDSRGRHTRTNISRDTRRGTPQGSPLSPLLANLYMRRFILGWRRWSESCNLGAQIVSYADDLVILCRRGTAQRALAAMRVLMGKLKLTVNEEKTRVCRVATEPFDFLGYTFGRYYSQRTGGAYLGLCPSKKSVQRMVATVRSLTDRRGCWQDTAKVVGQLNQAVTGWANYFSIGTTSKAYRAVETYMAERLRRWLLKKHKLRRSGLLMYSHEYLYQTLGLVKLSARRSNLSWAKT